MVEYEYKNEKTFLQKPQSVVEELLRIDTLSNRDRIKYSMATNALLIRLLEQIESDSTDLSEFLIDENSSTVNLSKLVTLINRFEENTTSREELQAVEMEQNDLLRRFISAVTGDIVEINSNQTI